MTFHTTINSSITGDGAIKYHFSEEASFHFLYLQISTYLLSKQTKKNLVTELSDSHRAGRGQGMLK